MAKQKPISVRLEDAAAENLQTIMEETGLNQSTIINQMLIYGDKVWVIDGRKLANELQKIRLHIEKPWLKDSDSCRLETLCNTATDYFYKMVYQAEEAYGDFESN